MTNILGPYYSPTHWRGEDETYMRELDSAWVNIHQPNARAIQQVQTCAPNANILLRSWDIDDNNGDRKREMYADPKGAARKHLEMWKAKWSELLTEMHRNGWTADESRWYLGMVNEPDPNFVRQVVEYSLEAMRLVRGTSIRLGLVASSVGTFKKPSEGDDGWTQCIPLEQPINDGRHILLVHEYWQPEGPSFGEDGGNLAWRHRHIPLDVPILIREAGANGYIYGRYSQNDDSGWQKTVADPKPETFAAQVKEYIEGCDQRVKGVLLYMLDFHSKQWWSFDTQPAMHQLLAIKGARPQVPSPFTKPPVDTRLPSVIAPGPQPPPEPGPTGDDWTRAYPLVLQIEGGFTNDSRDKGNWTGCAVGQGELKGTNHGISACSYPHLDIANLTQAQALDIYRRDYWLKSGADKLPWPLSLVHFDSYVQNPGAAQRFLNDSGGDVMLYLSKRLDWYTRIDDWHVWGAGWARRVAMLMREASK